METIKNNDINGRPIEENTPYVISETTRYIWWFFCFLYYGCIVYKLPTSYRIVVLGSANESDFDFLVAATTAFMFVVIIVAALCSISLKHIDGYFKKHIDPHILKIKHWLNNYGNN